MTKLVVASCEIGGKTNEGKPFLPIPRKKKINKSKLTCWLPNFKKIDSF